MQTATKTSDRPSEQPRAGSRLRDIAAQPVNKVQAYEAISAEIGDANRTIETHNMNHPYSYKLESPEMPLSTADATVCGGGEALDVA